MPLLIVNYHNKQIILPLFTRLLLCCGCNTSKKSASPDLDEFFKKSCVCWLVLGFWWFAHAWFMLSQDADSNQPFFVQIVSYAEETEAKQLSIRSISSTFCPPHELKVHHLPGMSCSRKLHQFGSSEWHGRSTKYPAVPPFFLCSWAWVLQAAGVLLYSTCNCRS